MVGIAEQSRRRSTDEPDRRVPLAGTTERPRSATLNSIQAARGIACAFVVAYHVATNFGSAAYGNMTVWGGWGELGRHGVDLFFVVSGFIIFNAHRQHFGKREFWGLYVYRRFARVYPVYWFYTLLLLALVALKVMKTALNTSPVDLLSAFSLIRFSSDKPPLFVAWTLFHEILFYALFSLLIVNRRLGCLALGAWWLWVAVAFSTRGSDHPTLLSVASDLYNLQFAMGLAVALIYRRLPRRVGAMVPALGLALLAVTGVAEHRLGGDNPPEVFILLYGAGSACVLLGLTSMEVKRAFFVPRVLRMMGDATFTTYLAHGMIMTAFLRVFGRMASGSVPLADVVCLMATAAIIALCYGLYLVIERPMLRLLTHRAPTKPLAATQHPWSLLG